MSREKQIKEMANDYYEAMLKASETLGSMNEGAPKWYAKELYAKGYRKASEVAAEIFAEIEKIVDKNTQMDLLEPRPELEIELKNGTSYIVSPTMKITGYNTRQIFRLILELKKKYTEGEG